MQRVLSFQMARGFGESSEFVTKRMCFSFLFSVGFLCLLCGFLLGRFAAERNMEFRVEKKRLQLAGNGLESTEYLQNFLLRELEKAPYDGNISANWETYDLKTADVHRTTEILSNLSFIHRVTKYKSCITASVRGIREPDRYVVLSASGEGIGIVVELAKVLNEVQEEHGWKPRRSIIFCIFSGSSDVCSEILPNFIRRKIVAYVAVHDHAFQGNGHFIVSGSNIIQSVVIQAVNAVQNLYSYSERLLSTNNWTYNDVTISHFTLDMPHAILSFANDSAAYNDNDRERGLRRIILAQVLGQTVWRASECLVVKWDPNHFNQSVSRALASVESSEVRQIKEKLREALVRLLINVEYLNKKIDATESTNALETRILNDLTMDLDRVLLCSDKKLWSKTNYTKLSHEPSNVIVTYFNETIKCYETAIQILHDW